MMAQEMKFETQVDAVALDRLEFSGAESEALFKHMREHLNREIEKAFGLGGPLAPIAAAVLKPELLWPGPGPRCTCGRNAIMHRSECPLANVVT